MASPARSAPKLAERVEPMDAQRVVERMGTATNTEVALVLRSHRFAATRALERCARLGRIQHALPARDDGSHAHFYRAVAR